MQVAVEPVLITGTSRGIGHALAEAWLDRGRPVVGISRSLPRELCKRAGYRHLSLDLSRLDVLQDELGHRLLHEFAIDALHSVYLNAGQFSMRIASLRQVPLSELQALMDLNVWANKVLLDTLYAYDVRVPVCVVSSSIAGVRARAGNSAYAVSKAALNMLMQLYAKEQPQTYFAVLGLCNVDTLLAQRIGALPMEGSFPDIEQLRVRGARSGFFVTPQERVAHLVTLLDRGLREHLSSGEFAEVRNLISEPWFTSADADH